MRHAFVIPAYGDSPFLTECLDSLVAQAARANIAIATATPSRFLRDTARRYDVALLERSEPPAIASDWNFALTAMDADLVTLAHQDDVFAQNYLSSMAAMFRSHPDVLIAFTGHGERTASGIRDATWNLRIKNWLTNRAFGSDAVIRETSRKIGLLRWGNPVCCPSVTLNRRLIPSFRFSSDFQINLDWDAWARLAAEPGAFAYLRETLVWHRIHSGTETTAGIADRRRIAEDLRMFLRFWPPIPARLIHTVYQLSYRANSA